MNIMSVIMLGFSILGGLDRILGNRFGLGKEFEKGFMLLGNMALSMIGMIILAPFLAELLAPCFDWVRIVLHLDPSIIPASLFANDMGGAPLAKEIASDHKVGMFNALVVSSMMGCTVSFSIPYALGVVKKENCKDMFFGMLCGIVTIPVGCFVAGLFCGIPVIALLWNLLPLIILAAIIACCLIFLPSIAVKMFSILGILMKAMITIGLLLGIFTALTGVAFVNGLADIWEGTKICMNAAVVLSGAFPMMYLVRKLLNKPLKKTAKKLSVSQESVMGFVSTLVTNATTFEMLNHMDRKGIIMNSAFLVSAAFVFGGHLAFTMAFDSSYIVPVMIGKLVAGASAVALSAMLCKNIIKEKIL